jgi:hypothetical protein
VKRRGGKEHDDVWQGHRNGDKLDKSMWRVRYESGVPFLRGLEQGRVVESVRCMQMRVYLRVLVGAM